MRSLSNRLSPPDLVLTILICLSLCLPLPARAASSVEFAKTWVSGVWMNLVTVDLNSADVSVTPAVARRGIGTSESFRSMMRRTRPAAAINGTFFDTRTLKPTGDIVIDRQLLCRGDQGVAIAIRNGREVRFIPSRHPDQYQWSDHDSVLVAGPTLVTQGKAAVVPWDEGFRSGVHFSKRIRAAVGLTYANKLVLVTTLRPVYLSRLARAMRSLGCFEAAALDGGGSAGLYSKGKLIRNPTRGMTNCLLVYDDPYAYQRRRSCFYPGGSSADDGGG